jgi:two-component system chemotaxis response regulator CheY
MKKKLLIVDDENDFFDFLRRILVKRFNCEAKWAENGSEALKILEDEEFDGIILDMQLPVMDGFDTLKNLKGNDQLSNIPVMMCTSIAEKEKVRDILSLGVNGYLLKPINNKESIQKIEKFLNQIPLS